MELHNNRINMGAVGCRSRFPGQFIFSQTGSVMSAYQSVLHFVCYRLNVYDVVTCDWRYCTRQNPVNVRLISLACLSHNRYYLCSTGTINILSITRTARMPHTYTGPVVNYVFNISFCNWKKLCYQFCTF